MIEGLIKLIGILFAYLDKPWKAVALVALFVFGGVGLTLYEKRDAIIKSWLTPSSESGLKTAEIAESIDKLGIETGADLVQIWAVDLSANSQWFIAARRKDGERPVIPSPRRLPIIVTTSDVKALIDVLEGNPVCLATTIAGSPLSRRLAERGMTRGCAIPIPPSPPTFVGVIYLAWFKPIDKTSEDVAVGAAREIASQLMTR